MWIFQGTGLHDVKTGSDDSLANDNVVKDISYGIKSPSSKVPSNPIEYTLAEDGPHTNSYGDSPKILRYVAKEQIGENSYNPISTLRWAQLLSEGEDADIHVQSFLSLLSNAPMNAYFFETKGVYYEQAKKVHFGMSYPHSNE